jgi:undecaprenyl-diphosphatase
LIEQLKNIDTELFLWLNSKHAPWLDTIMYWVSHKFFWIPLYLLLFILLLRQYGKRSWVVILAIAVTAVATDQAARSIKYSVKRYRPCHNLNICDQVHNPEKGSGKYGFVSSHAANTFGLALLFSLLMRRKKWTWILFSWAVLVAYSRIYNGVHYPSDIIAGAGLGMAIAYGIYFLLYKIRLLPPLNTTPS